MQIFYGPQLCLFTSVLSSSFQVFWLGSCILFSVRIQFANVCFCGSCCIWVFCQIHQMSYPGEKKGKSWHWVGMSYFCLSEVIALRCQMSAAPLSHHEMSDVSTTSDSSWDLWCHPHWVPIWDVSYQFTLLPWSLSLSINLWVPWSWTVIVRDFASSRI